MVIFHSYVSLPEGKMIVGLKSTHQPINPGPSLAILPWQKPIQRWLEVIRDDDRNTSMRHDVIEAHVVGMGWTWLVVCCRNVQGQCCKNTNWFLFRKFHFRKFRKRCRKGLVFRYQLKEGTKIPKQNTSTKGLSNSIECRLRTCSEMVHCTTCRAPIVWLFREITDTVAKHQKRPRKKKQKRARHIRSL